MIFNIQRFSTHDGDGIRTVIFYKGCPLRCLWCSNPESLSFGYSIMYDKNRCKNFGDCIKADNKAITRINKKGIQINRELIKNPEKLRDICASKALTISGESKSVDELLTEIEKDTLFYRNSGGVTLSGGEPLSHGEELFTFLQKLKSRNINVNIETSLHVNWRNVERCIGFVDTFLVDLKHTDNVKFKTFTQGDSELVKNNLIKLTDSETHVIVRIPVIPGFNFSENKGRILENIVFLELLRRGKDVFYHSAKSECDFVIKEGLEIVEAIQVSYLIDISNEQREYKGLQEALQTYKLQKGLLLTYDTESTVNIGTNEITITPVWKWLLAGNTNLSPKGTD